MPPSPRKPRLAILFRYGAGEHIHFLPALPELCEALSDTHEVHHFGFRSREPIPPLLAAHARIHTIGPRVRRQSETDKRLKALLWLLMLPGLGLYLRIRKFEILFVDETLPLSALLLRLTHGGRIAMTVHDFFMDIYFLPNRGLRRIGRWIKALDLYAWRKLDHLFTRVEAARDFLIDQGVPPDNITVAHDPCNLDLFCPRPQSRSAIRTQWGFRPEHLVLVHHGVMHPNKGNDRILRAIARVREDLPNLRLLLIGEGPEYERLQQLVHELALTRHVRMTGWLGSMQEVAETLNAGDLGLVMRIGGPGDHFHVTSTLVHNLAAGLPVLAARLEGIQEIITEGKEGCMFDPVCEAEFDEKLRQFAQNPQRHIDMSRAARRTAEQKFDRNKIALEMAAGLRRHAPPPKP